VTRGNVQIKKGTPGKDFELKRNVKKSPGSSFTKAGKAQDYSACSPVGKAVGRGGVGGGGGWGGGGGGGGVCWGGGGGVWGMRGRWRGGEPCFSDFRGLAFFEVSPA